MTRHRLCALLVGIVFSLASPALAHAQETVIYYHTDAIGSVRMITNENGQVIARYDYLPFGQPCGAACQTAGAPDARQFAGKERDPETEFDYFGARYYEGRTGRFTSVDPMLDIEQSLEDPQSWNRYVYARNNPLTNIDPDGRRWLHHLLFRLSQHPTLVNASIAAQRYATQAYVWATSFFNSPTGQEVTAFGAEAMSGAQLPFGFSSAAQLQSFSRTLDAGLSAVGGDAARAFLTGSAVTGASFRTGAAFDVGRTSDFDIALVSGNLLAKAKELGLELRGKGIRTGPLRLEDLKALGLDKLAQQLSQMAGRPVNFMIYESEEALRARGAGYLPF